MRKYRICMLCDTLGLGGVETHVVTLANRLAREGHEVTVVSGGGALARALLGVHHVTLPLHRKSRAPYLFFALWRLFRRGRFEVIHAHTRFSAFLCRPLAGRRLVTTAHWVFDTSFPKGMLTVWGEQTLAVSSDIAAYLSQAYGVRSERITVTVNGIDTERFRPQKKDGQRRRIVYCSRMDHDRADAAFLLLEAIASLPKDVFSLTVLGDGDRLAELAAKACALKERFPALSLSLVGGVTDVAAYLSDADIFIGVSRAALEGMAAGCAVILAGNEGYLSVFTPKAAAPAEETNFCCRGAPKATAELLQHDLERLLSRSTEELHAMGEENRRYVLQKYGEAQMVRDALSVYERICKRDVVLCGYFGFHNVGDALLARAFFARLAREGYRHVHLLSAKRPSPRAFFALRRGYDFILGGGNLLQDATSRRSLWFYLFCASLAKGHVEIFGGLGPLSVAGEKRVRPLLARADAVFCRTGGDLALAKRLGAKAARRSADAVLTLPVPKSKKGERIMLAFKAPQREDYAALLAFVLSLCRTFGRERLFVYVMHPSDRAIAKRIACLCRIPLYDEGVDGCLFHISKCRAVFASRLHAGVAALAAGVPFSLWKEEEKCRFFVEDLRRLSSGAPFCSLFSYSDRPHALLPSDGIEDAREAMRARL